MVATVFTNFIDLDMNLHYYCCLATIFFTVQNERTQKKNDSLVFFQKFSTPESNKKLLAEFTCCYATSKLHFTIYSFNLHNALYTPKSFSSKKEFYTSYKMLFTDF